MSFVVEAFEKIKSKKRETQIDIENKHINFPFSNVFFFRSDGCFGLGRIESIFMLGMCNTEANVHSHRRICYQFI